MDRRLNFDEKKISWMHAFYITMRLRSHWDTRNRCNPYTMLQERVTLEDTLAKILGRSREPKGHSE